MDACGELDPFHEDALDCLSSPCGEFVQEQALDGLSVPGSGDEAASSIAGMPGAPEDDAQAADFQMDMLHMPPGLLSASPLQQMMWRSRCMSDGVLDTVAKERASHVMSSVERNGQ